MAGARFNCRYVLDLYRSHRRIELRIIDATDGSIAHSVVVGDSNTDYKGQGLADLGGDQFVIVWNYTPSSQLPNQGASAETMPVIK